MTTNEGTNDPTASNEHFFVGYLETPPSIATFVRRFVTVGIVAALGVAWMISRSQDNPGEGEWHADGQSFVGRVSATPYPLIRIISDRPGSPIETILLVSQGKHGSRDAVAAFDGAIAEVRGTILERDGRRLLELAETDAIRPSTSLSKRASGLLVGANAPPATSTPSRTTGRVTLRGEIIDPKCYSGAMKPGNGKTHKECATLCIAGGIPPMFVAQNPSGEQSYFLLVDADGRALEGQVLHDRVLPFVADDVELSGDLEVRDDMTMLRLAPESIRRL